MEVFFGIIFSIAFIWFFIYTISAIQALARQALILEERLNKFEAETIQNYEMLTEVMKALNEQLIIFNKRL